MSADDADGRVQLVVAIDDPTLGGVVSLRYETTPEEVDRHNDAQEYLQNVFNRLTHNAVDGWGERHEWR